MARINQKLSTLHKALGTLRRSIELFPEYKKNIATKATPTEEEIALGLRDSIVQRFEYCTDLFWKLIKIYLEDVEKITLTTYSPRSVIREAVLAKIISEDQGEDCMKMIDSRNLTSHTYREEVAEDLSAKISGYYHLMKATVDAIEDRLKLN